jgi:hypothetical protein
MQPFNSSAHGKAGSLSKMRPLKTPADAPSMVMFARIPDR